MTWQRPAALGAVTPLTQWAAWIVPVAAGIFAGSVVFDAAPTAQAALGPVWMPIALTGFALMVLSGRWARTRSARGAALVATGGVWLHSLLEGLTAGSGVAFGIGGGIAIALGVLVHLVPEGVALFTVATEAGLSAGRALARCAATWLLVLGGFVVAQGGPVLPAGPLGAGMALAAGTFSFLAWALWRSSYATVRIRLLSAAAGFLWVLAIHL